MSYKPKHCCECGDKIERANWGWSASRRFCELCGTNFKHLDWTPRIAVAASLFLTAVSIGLYFRRPEKNILVSANQPQNISANANRNAVSPSDAPKQFAASTIAQQANANLTMTAKPATDAAAAKPLDKTKSTEIQQRAAPETVYFCGAQTKKGTPCSRHVKQRGARCWQHTGQTAMLPPDKLVAN